jgi:hypothetical protein
MVAKIIHAAHGHHKSTTAAHAAGKRGMPPLVGKRHEDKKANHGVLAKVKSHKRTAHG